MDDKNKFNLPIYILLKCFNETGNHKLDIDISNNKILSKTLESKKTHTIKIDSLYNFKSSSIVKINFNWTGDEHANKYLKILKICVNDQKLSLHNLFYYPIKNEYIKKLSANEYKEKILKPGKTYGWYGRLTSTFKLGNSIDIKKLTRNDAYNLIIPGGDKVYIND